MSRFQGVAVDQPAEVDVLLVSLGSTSGLRAVDGALADSMRRAGASVVVAAARRPPTVRTLALTDLGWAIAARRAAQAALRRYTPRALVYSTSTAALLWPARGAIRFDSCSAVNRPGRHGLWQRPIERRRLREARLLLPQSHGALLELPLNGRARLPALVVGVPIEPSTPDPGSPRRDIAAITYGANPQKKGLDRVLSAWRRIRHPGEELVIAGVAAEDLLAGRYLAPGEEGVRVVGTLAPADYRALLRRAHLFVCAPRREDYGIAQLEALADGCLLVTTPAPGPYVALPIARALDARLVGDDLAEPLRTALDRPLAGYAVRAREALAPHTREAIDRVVAEQLLPRLLA